MSIPFGWFFGARLRVHLLFLLMLPLAYLAGILSQFLLIFTLVLLHELCHSIAALALGIRVEEIELLPFGGVARLSAEMEISPGKELLIALAGPASNLLLSMLALLLNYVVPLPPQSLAAFLSANLTLAGLNLLPALPLDGGRVFRALLSKCIGLKRATRLSSLLGIALGCTVFLLGLWTAWNGKLNITFLISGILLTGMAYREGKSATALHMRDITMRQQALYRDGTLRVRHLVAPADIRVADIAKHFSPRHYHRITLLDANYNEYATLPESAIVNALLSHRSHEEARGLVEGRRDEETRTRKRFFS